MKNERLEALVQRGRSLVAQLDRQQRFQNAVETIIREAWLMGKSEYVDRPPFADGYAKREPFACEVCGNVPDKNGKIEHGKGCYVVSSDGGGETWVDLNEITDEGDLP